MVDQLTKSQIEAIAEVASRVDGGCVHCAAHTVRDLERHWPDVDWRESVGSRLPLDHEVFGTPNREVWDDILTEAGS